MCAHHSLVETVIRDDGMLHGKCRECEAEKEFDPSGGMDRVFRISPMADHHKELHSRWKVTVWGKHGLRNY